MVVWVVFGWSCFGCIYGCFGCFACNWFVVVWFCMLSGVGSFLFVSVFEEMGSIPVFLLIT